MSKLDQIVAFLETEKTDVAVVSDPVTINYLTGFYSDPHERQLFLFVYPDHEPLLFVPASRSETLSSTIPYKYSDHYCNDLIICHCPDTLPL